MRRPILTNPYVTRHLDKARLEESIAQNRRALAIYEQAYGDDEGHPNVAQVCNDLGTAYKQQGRFDPAKFDEVRIS